MYEKKIIVKNEKEIRLIDVEKLLAITINDYLCSFHVENEKVFICSKSLKKLETILPDYFIRISRNCIINSQKIKLIDVKKQSVVLSSGFVGQISCRKFKIVKQILLNKQ